MEKSITLEIDGVGQVLFERSHKAKHLNISVKPFKGVRVAVPVGLSFKKAEKVMRSKVEWIKRHQERMSLAELEHESILRNSVEIDRAEARAKLMSRLNKLTEKNGFTYNRIFIRNQKTRWGSCSSKNNLNLNVKLVRLPDELMDYVILHELVHTKIKNHRKEFWAELDKLVGDGKKLQSRLKEYGLGFL